MTGGTEHPDQELMRTSHPRRDPLIVVIAGVLVASLVGALGWFAVAIGELKKDIGELNGTVAALPDNIQRSLDTGLVADLQGTIGTVVRTEIEPLRTEVNELKTTVPLHVLTVPAEWQNSLSDLENRLRYVEEFIRVSDDGEP